MCKGGRDEVWDVLPRVLLFALVPVVATLAGGCPGRLLHPA